MVNRRDKGNRLKAIQNLIDYILDFEEEDFYKEYCAKNIVTELNWTQANHIYISALIAAGHRPNFIRLKRINESHFTEALSKL